MVPPLTVRVLVPPLPKAVVPLAITVPALRVKPPGKAAPAEAKTPAPFLINPVPAAVEIACPLKSNSPPLQISKVHTLATVLNEHDPAV